MQWNRVGGGTQWGGTEWGVTRQRGANWGGTEWGGAERTGYIIASVTDVEHAALIAPI